MEADRERVELQAGTEVRIKNVRRRLFAVVVVFSCSVFSAGCSSVPDIAGRSQSTENLRTKEGSGSGR